MNDVTEATFQTEVIEPSMTRPVVVELWSERSDPSNSLGTVLDELVAARGGAVGVVAVDIDANPTIAQAFRAEQVPSAYVVVEGKPFLGFAGPVSRAEAEAFLDQLIPPPSEADVLADAGDEDSLRQALALDPGHAGAIEALARILIDSARPTEALELLARIPETPEVHTLNAEARLAEAHVSTAEAEIVPKLDELLERAAADEVARQEYLDLLEALGAANPLTASYRKALAARLF